MRIIGLWGFAQSGKDSVGKILVSRGYVRFAFADALKKMANELDPIVQVQSKYGFFHQVHLATLVGRIGWDEAKKNPSVREYLQTLGVANRRVDQDVWVRPLDTVIRANAGVEGIVVTDCRFDNEVAKVWKAGGELWRVSRPGVGPVNGHESETAIANYPFDYEVRNDGDLENLEYQVITGLSRHAR